MGGSWALSTEFRTQTPPSDQRISFDYHRSHRYVAVALLTTPGLTPTLLIPIGLCWASLFRSAARRLRRGPLRRRQRHHVALVGGVRVLAVGMSAGVGSDWARSSSHSRLCRGERSQAPFSERGSERILNEGNSIYSMHVVGRQVQLLRTQTGILSLLKPKSGQQKELSK